MRPYTIDIQKNEGRFDLAILPTGSSGVAAVKEGLDRQAVLTLLLENDHFVDRAAILYMDAVEKGKNKLLIEQMLTDNDARAFGWQV